MKRARDTLIWTILVVAQLVVSNCSGQQNAPRAVPPNSNVAATPPPSSPLATPPLQARNATLTADPNPIKVCDGSGLGVTTLTYSFQPPVAVTKVCVSSPSCTATMATAVSGGRVTTGKWVGNETVFYLQDVTGGRALAPENTLATATIRVTTAGCP
jgi:hypothetical protein